LKETDMPIINVQYEEGALDAPRKAAIAERLTELLLSMEGGAKTSGGRAFATVLFTPLQPGNWWVGGRSDDQFVAVPGKFLVHVTIPEGYMNTAHKAEVHAGVKTAIVGVLSDATDPQQGASVLAVIDEVTEGNWSAHGTALGMASIAESVGLPKDGERFAWVRAYFAAKARQFAAAGYPKDTGGLMTTDLDRLPT
jgi:phenylpyruvate tautomerase PptA (4-oxalocrotonate tautomerase family)